MQIRTILVPTDFSPDATAALDLAVDLARRFDARIELFHAYHLEVPPFYAGLGGDFTTPFDIVEPIRKEAEGAMEKLVADVGARGVETKGRVVMERAAAAIVDEAERLGADLVVLGTRGLTGLDHMLLGSTAERVVRLAPCPVLTVKAKPA